MTNIVGASVVVPFDGTSLHVSHLTAGVYLVEIKTPIGETIEKLVVR